MKQFCDLQLPISDCVSLIMDTITRHVFKNICQIEHYSAVRFDMIIEKNMTCLVIRKSPKVWKNKVGKIGLGSFNSDRKKRLIPVISYAWCHTGPSEQISFWCCESGLIFIINESGASGASNGVGSRGPLKGPWRGPGVAPGSFWVSAFVKGSERSSWNYFFL